jgi:hypothetical protein
MPPLVIASLGAWVKNSQLITPIPREKTKYIIEPRNKIVVKRHKKSTKNPKF